LSNGKIQTIVASFQTPEKFKGENISSILRKRIATWLKNEVDEKFKGNSSIDIIVNPCGDWEVGGFDADAGMTGRKLVVDNYGPRIPIGGGAFSGKDPSKVDRSAAYMARRIAVDYLKKYRAHEVFVYLAYAIGKAEPVEAAVIIDGQSQPVTGYDLTPHGIIQLLDLKKPRYEQLARDGHHFDRL
jgi:S-adenosylmethionine synthetase